MSDHSEQLTELAAALSAAQAEFSAVPKTDLNPFFKSKFAGLPTVVEHATPILTKHGLSISQHPDSQDGHDVLTTWVLHKSGQWLKSSMRLHLVKDDPQAHGSAITYARRYAFMAALGLVADEDDDGNRASARRANGHSSAPPPKSEPVTSNDVAALRSAAGGLSGAQVKLAMASVGVDAPEPFKPETAFLHVPREKAAKLTEALSGVER